MKSSLSEANFIKRGDSLGNQSTYEGAYCSSFCVHHKIINNDTPNAYSICTLHNIRVDFYDSCDRYLSMFDADPDLLKPFLTNSSEPKKKKNWLSRLFK